MAAVMSRIASGKPIVSTTALARHLGLSRWTISRVLNGHPEVKPETSRRVREAMDELGFVPSLLGRALRSARTGLVGVSFQAIGLPIISRKIETLQNVIRGAGFRALLEVTDGSPELELTVIRHFLAMRVDGLILVGGIRPSNAGRIKKMLESRGMPVVLVDPMEPLPLPTVELDREAGIQATFEHLFEMGHRRFALLGVDESVPYGSIRCQALRRVLAQHGFSWEENVVTIANSNQATLDFNYGRELADRFASLPSRPGAILALNDQIAIGAMARLRSVGIAIPEDVSIVGFDNLEVADHTLPPLTTVDQHIDEIVQRAVAMLVESADEPAESERTMSRISPMLIKRGSTAPPA